MINIIYLSFPTSPMTTSTAVGKCHLEIQNKLGT